MIFCLCTLSLAGHSTCLAHCTGPCLSCGSLRHRLTLATAQPQPSRERLRPCPTCLSAGPASPMDVRQTYQGVRWFGL